MRLFFHNNDQPKRIAKSIARHTPATLSACQETIAKASGYRDWHELTGNLKAAVSSLWFESAPIDRQSEFIVDVARMLECDQGKVQFALSEAKAFLSGSEPYVHQLELRARCFRRTTIPDLGPRQPGSVGMSKPWKEAVILKKFGKPTDVISNKHWNAGLADFEYSVPKKPIPLFIPMRLYVLYGMYVEPDGSRVLYSRDYEPMWRLRDGKRPERFSAPEYIPHIDSIGFWDDRNTPWRNPERYAEELQRLKDHGITGLPWKVEGLPAMVRGEF